MAQLVKCLHLGPLPPQGPFLPWFWPFSCHIREYRAVFTLFVPFSRIFSSTLNVLWCIVLLTMHLYYALICYAPRPKEALVHIFYPICGRMSRDFLNLGEWREFSENSTGAISENNVDYIRKLWYNLENKARH